MRNIDLNLLRAFLSIYEERNVTRAAVRLNLSQSATSNALTRLRSALNDPLFIRTADGLVPTAKAEAMNGPVRESLERIDNILEATLGFDPATAPHRFRVCVPDHTLSTLLPVLLAVLSEKAPHVELDLQPPSETTLEHLRTGEIDLLISYLLGPKPDNLRVTRLFTEESVVVVAEDHPTIGDSLGLEQYLNAGHVVLRPYGTLLSSPIDRRLQEFGRARRVKMVVASHLTAFTVVRSTALIASVPGNLARRLASDLSVKLFPLPFEFSGFDMMLAWHERAHHDPAHRWFRQLLAKFRDQI